MQRNVKNRASCADDIVIYLFDDASSYHNIIAHHIISHHIMPLNLNEEEEAKDDKGIVVGSGSGIYGVVVTTVFKYDVASFKLFLQSLKFSLDT